MPNGERGAKLSKNRFLALKYFCLCYPEWKAALARAGESPRDPLLVKRIALVEATAARADPQISPWLLMAVTRGMTYKELYMRHDMPCCAEYFYQRRKIFFNLLDVALDDAEREGAG